MPEPRPTPSRDPTRRYEATGSRPGGVTALAVVSVLGGLLTTLIALGLVVGGTVAGFLLVPLLGPAAPALGLLLALPVAAFSLTHFVLAWGLWRGHGWARVLALVVATLWGVFALFDLAIGDPNGLGALLIVGLTWWYLTRDPVKRWFGHRHPQLA